MRDASYDYRYAWIRDQAFAGQAVAKAGPYPLMDDAVRFMTARLLADGSALKPAYTALEGDVPDERKLSLPGYPGGTDIVGNWVNKQFQLDAFGEALLLFAAAAEHDHLDVEGWRAAEVAVEAIEQRWCEPNVDAGIWELEPDSWTHSRLICAAGLRRSPPTGPPASRRPAGSPWPTSSSQTRLSTRCTHRGAGSARPGRAGRRRAAAPDNQGSARCRGPTVAGDAEGGTRGTHPGRLLLPVPTRRAAPRRGRGSLPRSAGT